MYFFAFPRQVNNDEVHKQPYEGELSSSSGNIGVGAREDEFEPCDAEIAVARIYTRALSAAELQTNFDAEKARFGLGDVKFDNFWTPTGARTHMS